MNNQQIIVIDDDNDDRVILKEVFDEMKVENEILFFKNGETAYQHLLQLKIQPFFILCDVYMPLFTGFDLMKKINENEALKIKAIPFIFFSASDSAKTINKAFKLNVQGYFVKPGSVEKFESN